MFQLREVTSRSVAGSENDNNDSDDIKNNIHDNDNIENNDDDINDNNTDNNDIKNNNNNNDNVNKKNNSSDTTDFQAGEATSRNVAGSRKGGKSLPEAEAKSTKER